KLHKKTPSLKELPAIFLEGWDDPVNMQWGYEYAQPAFYLRSYDGEISKKIISSKIHLAGGFDQLCLRRTIQDLTRYFDQSSLSEMSLFIYPELIISQHILLRPHSVLDKYHFSLLESILNPYHQTQTFHETLDTWMTSIMGFFEYKIQGWYQDESTLKLKINIKDILYTNNSNSNFLESKLSDNKKFFLILSIEENRETSQVTIFIQNTYPEISPVE
ncbi:MAG: hypothetical protein KBD63_03360, partial [Bacteriovoracaceae bacterium]|nr:hypothetical protein [Bacteriovoracaceae bacterium]